ncbi:hypothetical protein PV04_09132 [Phialophora macrospora]|uniref:Clr5 domain-containing protein n=1 Tax=Phialophora macrospora TaxID=1851006 RepID=A0A0D2FW08_9EURO|nr:hypothetical protein PV04_09132 [Phialophora macrospora]
MDMPMDVEVESRSIYPQASVPVPSLAGVPHDKRWGLMKSLLEPLFHTHKVKDIARIMKEQHGFSANEPSYRYHFKQWGWKKHVSTATKNHILRHVQARAAQGKATTAIVAGRKIDGKKLKRQARFNARQEYAILDSSSRLDEQQTQVFGRYLPFGNKMLSPPFAVWSKNRVDQL